MGKKTVVVKMEENYMRMIISYEDKDDRVEICEAVGKVERETKIFPEVIHKNTSKTSSSFSIEFSGDEHVGSRDPGVFIEKLLKDLDIKECDNC
ncbi:MAG: hypothetical protein B1H07_04805 [Campylobacteraceae bacterium 4484_166]|nr:MAG: hypothetical protein B1H07_04805 [Campylobacteraceae bacterium 4484_166]